MTGSRRWLGVGLGAAVVLFAVWSLLRTPAQTPTAAVPSATQTTGVVRGTDANPEAGEDATRSCRADLDRDGRCRWASPMGDAGSNRGPGRKRRARDAHEPNRHVLRGRRTVGDDQGGSGRAHDRDAQRRAASAACMRSLRPAANSTPGR